MSLINGWNMQQAYNNGNNNAINRGANTGKQVANLNARAASGDLSALFQLMTSDIQYTTQENGKFSIDGGLAYSKESLKGLDANRDGAVSTQEAGPIGGVIDLNNDGKISASENLAYTMYQDAAGNMDGVVTAQERMAADRALMADPAKARQQMSKLHEGHDLANREQQLDNKNMMNQFMQFFGQMIQMLMTMFGFNQNQNQNSYGTDNANSSLSVASNSNSFAIAGTFNSNNWNGY